MNVKLRNLGALCKLVNNHYTVPMSIPKCDSAVETKLESFTNVCIRKYTRLNCNGSIKKYIFFEAHVPLNVLLNVPLT